MSSELEAASARECEQVVARYAALVALTREEFAAWQRGELPPAKTLDVVGDALAKSPCAAAHPLVIVLAGGPRDDASRAVQAAMLTLAAARRVTRDPRALRHLALAALLVDAGRVRLAGTASLDLDVFQQLPDTLDALAPASSAALGLAGDHAEDRLASAGTAFEVAWLERPQLGPLYAGQLAPRFGAQLIWVVRAFLDRVAPRSGKEPSSPLDALQSLARATPTVQDAVALLAAAIGLPPVGTVLELGTGEWAVVAPSPSGYRGAPLARFLTDRRGKPLDPAPLKALSGPDWPVRAVPPSEARFNLARAFVGREIKP